MLQIQTIDFLSMILYFFIIALIIAIVNFCIGLYLTLKMASLKGLTKDRKPAIVLNSVWSLVSFILGLNPFTMVFAFFINLILGMIALKYEQFYGLEKFKKRLTFLLTILLVQLILTIIIYLIGFFLIIYLIMNINT